MNHEDLRWPGFVPLDHILERPGGEPPIEGVITDDSDCLRMLRLVLPAGTVIDVITTMDGGLSVAIDGEHLVATPDYPDRGLGPCCWP